MDGVVQIYRSWQGCNLLHKYAEWESFEGSSILCINGDNGSVLLRACSLRYVKILRCCCFFVLFCFLFFFGGGGGLFFLFCNMNMDGMNSFSFSFHSLYTGPFHFILTDLLLHTPTPKSIFTSVTSKCEPPHDKINKMTYAPSEDSDQPGHLPSLTRVFAVRFMGSWGPNVSSCGQRRLWSDWADAKADLSLRREHMSFCSFCHRWLM